MIGSWFTQHEGASGHGHWAVGRAGERNEEGDGDCACGCCQRRSGLAEEPRQRNRNAARGKSYGLKNGNVVRFADLMMEFYSIKNQFLGSRPYAASEDTAGMASAGALDEASVA